MNALITTLLRSTGLCAAAAFALIATPVQAQTTGPKIVKKVPMDFPGEAIRRGVDRGVLKTRVTIDASGKPTEVAVLETQPAKAKILNETVVEALQQWRWEGQGKPTSFDLQIVLTAD